MMKCRRHSIRLRGYDYAREGYYFVTMCTYKRQSTLGVMNNHQFTLNQFGEIVNQCWLDIPKHFPISRLDNFQIMPNHMHGIIVIDVGAGSPRPDLGRGNRAPTLGQILAYFKYQSTKYAHQSGYREEKFWQRNYYEHIIRNERDYWAIKKYIVDNPKNWEQDELFQDLPPL